MFRATGSNRPGGLLKSFIPYSGSTLSSPTNVQEYAAPSLEISSIVSAGGPESVRVRLETCTTQFIQCPLESPCDHFDGTKCTITIPVGTAPKPTVVRTIPASETTKRVREAALLEASNPYDPATRFAIYQEPMPPQPAFLQEPVYRPPNPAPVFKPGTNCVINRFAGSSDPTE
jgi:hypothetical protein